MTGSKKRPGPARAKPLAASDDVIGGPLTGTRSLGGLARARAPSAPRRLSEARRLPDSRRTNEWLAEASHAIYDWNSVNVSSSLVGRSFTLCDETLRDGLQSPSVTDPSVEEKVELLHLMSSLGIGAITVGLPGAGERAYRDSLALVREAVRTRLPARLNLSARTMEADLRPIADIAQATGAAVTAYTFIGSSPIRLFAEGWTLSTLLRHVETAVSFAVREGIEVCLVTEDTTRARPDVLDPLFRTAISLGARRLCLCDTVGHATPDGVRGLVAWTRNLIVGCGAEVGLDWHGHNDRGLAVINSLVALEAGADRAHGTGLGLGERVGNAAMDQLLINLKLGGAYEHDISNLARYCELVASACQVEIPASYPVFGRDAFRTATGVHAAAIIKAQRKGDTDYADRVYSGVPASWVGRNQAIEISHMSGASNVMYWLEAQGLPADQELIATIMQRAKSMRRVLSDDELHALVASQTSADSDSTDMAPELTMGREREADATVN
ncbi:MAG: LeuA family protein [Myxococcota bacterium]